jgi:hypothetical protein
MINMISRSIIVKMQANPAHLNSINTTNTIITARRTEAGVLEEGLFQQDRLVTGRKTLPGGLMCDGDFNLDGSLAVGSLINKPIYQQGTFERGRLVEGLATEWLTGKPIQFEFGTRHNGSLIHGIRSKPDQISIGDFYHHSGSLLCQGVLVEPNHAQVGYFSVSGCFDIGVNVIYNNNEGDIFEVGRHDHGHLDYGTRVKHLDTIEAGRFNDTGILVKGLTNKLGDIHVGEFTDNQLVLGTHLNRAGHVESGQFDPTTHEIRVGHRLYGYKEDLNIYERGTFDEGHLTGFGLRVYTNYIEQGNFNNGDMHDGIRASSLHMEYITHAMGPKRVYRFDKECRSIYVGDYHENILEGYRMNFDDLDTPLIERIQNGRVLKKYRLVEVE